MIHWHRLWHSRVHVLDIISIQESARFQPEILSIQFELTQQESHQRFLKSCQPPSDQTTKLFTN